jgi:prepilin-type N-terminal cleavage/methylation domain-containing protein
MLRRAQRGFTLIEMMIALLIGTLLVIMILSIFSRMSFAYREQQQIITVQQSLAAARNAIEIDAKQAGLEMSQGFKIAEDGYPANPGGPKMHSPVRIINSATAPDEVGFYYADPSAQALVTTGGPPAVIDVDNSVGFAAGDLVVLSRADTTTLSNPVAPATDAKITTYDACVLKIVQINVNNITFSQAAPWGRPGNDHCSPAVAGQTMMYKFVAHYWRIDPLTGTRAADGVLQLDTLGNLATNTNAWTDEAYGFTDLQVATYFYEQGDVTDTLDPDLDATRDWYSDGVQKTRTDPIGTASTFIPPLLMTMSLVARTDSDVEGIYTTSTPRLVDPANIANNMTGDHDTVDLTTTADPHLTGKRIYRYLTFQVDLRNLGVGR